ncbi:ABC transporter ATP-binding protein [Limibacillus sp. MBR-115]|jgi:putative spermidine/putrescine transport system ATP-binding protein|uniref:ABC transporter ATP-binding protein n=1 Tax=Limibacillus sp. MBR-115 TaxID=3156465 RepID=UPI00339664D6
MTKTQALPADITTIVRFVKVDKCYDNGPAIIKNLNLEIRKGEFLTLLGPSGSGKTTTLMMLAGFENPSSGAIYLRDRLINNVNPEHRNAGMVFQNYALFPHLTVAENVAFSLRVRRVTKSEQSERVRHALDMVQLGAFKDRKPAQLSGGQQQRVALARALIFKPEIVLMDEPLGALDKQLREHMQIEIKHLHENLGVTMVYVTHDQSEALTMSDRIAVFKDGRIEQLSDPGTLYEAPETAFAAQFIGESNRLTGKLETCNGEFCQVRLPDGTAIRARKISVGAPGTDVSVSVRPERVSVIKGDISDENVLTGSIVDLIYLGTHSIARLSAPGCEEFDVSVPARSGILLRKGAVVSVAWNPDACRAFKSD